MTTMNNVCHVQRHGKKNNRVGDFARRGEKEDKYIKILVAITLSTRGRSVLTTSDVDDRLGVNREGQGFHLEPNSGQIIVHDQ